mgnify:CR=1 FL=1
MTLLSIKDLSLSIGAYKILHDIDLAMEAGEIVAITGANGALGQAVAKQAANFGAKQLILIEMGVLYLKRLLKMFKGSYRLATVAYNMGPGGVYRRLRRKQEVGVNNQYLDKVRRHYKLISKNFSKKSSRKYLSLRSTLVVDNPRSNYLYTRLNDFDEVFHFIEFPSFDYRLALNSIGHSQKSL